MYILSPILASTYGTGTYSSSTYESSASTGGGTGPGTSAGGTTTTGTTAAGGNTVASGSRGVLTNTGFDILLAASLACLIIFAALVIRFWKKPAKGEVS